MICRDVVAELRSPDAEIACPAAKLATITLRKSGVRPIMPPQRSIQIFTMSRRRRRSPADFGWICDSPTGAPVVGDERSTHRGIPRRAAYRRAPPGTAASPEAAVRRDVPDALAVDPDLAAVLQRLDKRIAGARTHRSILPGFTASVARGIAWGLSVGMPASPGRRPFSYRGSQGYFDCSGRFN